MCIAIFSCDFDLKDKIIYVRTKNSDLWAISTCASDFIDIKLVILNPMFKIKDRPI